MPIYSYQCGTCGAVHEHIVAYAQRDATGLRCDACQAAMHRQVGVELPTIGRAAHQMGVTMADGRRVKGHFGKEAPRTRRAKA